MRQRHIFSGVLFCVAFVFLTLVFGWYKDRYVPIKEPFATLPDPAKVGNVEAAMQQTAKLVAALRTNNWHPRGLPFALMKLPDARFAEDINQRDPLSANFVCTALGSEADAPSRQEIAAYTNIYVRTRPKVFKGDRFTFAPTGFYIVGWKNGKVEKVPIADVRFVKFGKNYHAPVFPGMKAWKANGMRDSFIEYANGYENARPEAKEFYKATTDPECESCKQPKT